MRNLMLFVFLMLIAITMSWLSPEFRSPENLLDLSRHLAEAGIISLGMTLVIMTGGIDLSVGSLLGLVGIVLGYSWQPYGAVAAFALALFAGVAGGALNGVFVTAAKLPPLIVTLATMALFRGIAMIISQAKPVSHFPAWFPVLGQGGIGPVPTQLIVWFVLVGLALVLVGRTVLGRYAAAIGNNERAATVAALPVSRVKMAAYMLTGLMCAIAAIIFTSRVSTAKADAGEGLELEVITAVVLGGTSITGGRGTILGTFLGVLILGLLRNGLILAGISSVWQTIFAGVVLIVTALLNRQLTART
jgi:rhamnose transport system permease protein